jgi:hypothetical protein
MKLFINWKMHIRFPLILFLISILGIVLGIGISGRKIIELQYNTWSVSENIIYIGTNEGIVMVNTEGQLLEKLIWNISVVDLTSTGNYLAALTENSDLIILHGNLFINVSLPYTGQNCSVFALENTIACLCTLTLESIIHFYSTSGILLQDVYLPYVASKAIHFNSSRDRISIVNSHMYHHTGIMTAFSNGAWSFLPLNESKGIHTLTRSSRRWYCGEKDGISIFNDKGNRIRYLNTNGSVVSHIYFYEERMIYLTGDNGDTGTSVLNFRSGSIVENITQNYTHGHGFSPGLFVNKQGVLVWSLPGEFLLYQLN